MKEISSKELRELWNTFWVSKQHVYLPESSLVGGKESAAMFTVA
jgi:alanyl-tRNA synthetase